MRWTPKVDERIYDSIGSVITVVFVTATNNSFAAVDSNNELFIYEKLTTNRYVDQMDESIYILGPATPATWNIFQQSQDIEND